MGTRRGPRLASVGDVVDFLAKVTREVYCDRIEIKKASTIGYLCAQLRGCFEVADLEERITNLEAQLSQRRKSTPATVAPARRLTEE